MTQLVLKYNNYIGTFYKITKQGLRKFWRMGNTGIAIEIAQKLQKLGHKIIYLDETGDSNE